MLSMLSLFAFFLATPRLLTSPLPRQIPKFWPSGAWDKGKPRWRLPLFNDG